MLTGLDHIAVVVLNLNTAVKKYEQQGFKIIQGGKHPKGTHNALISLADGTYIELIAFYEPNSEHPWWSKAEQGGGLVDFCFGTNDISADLLRFREAGVNMSDATPGGRIRPDGFQISWLLSMPDARHRGLIPFLIEDKTPRDERVPKETTHQNQATGIGTITIAVDELQTIRRCYANVLQNDGYEIDREDLNAIGVRFTIGRHNFDFVSLNRPTNSLRNRLQIRGNSPYSVTLGTISGKEWWCD